MKKLMKPQMGLLIVLATAALAWQGGCGRPYTEDQKATARFPEDFETTEQPSTPVLQSEKLSAESATPARYFYEVSVARLKVRESGDWMPDTDGDLAVVLVAPEDAKAVIKKANEIASKGLLASLHDGEERDIESLAYGTNRTYNGTLRLILAVYDLDRYGVRNVWQRILGGQKLEIPVDERFFDPMSDSFDWTLRFQVIAPGETPIPNPHTRTVEDPVAPVNHIELMLRIKRDAIVGQLIGP